MWRRFIELFDWVARVHFAGTAGWAVAGWAVTFFATSANGWDVSAVWLASLFAGACCAIIFMAFRAASFAVIPKQPDGTHPEKFTGFSVANGRLIQRPAKPAGDPFPRAFNVPRIWFQNPDLSSKGLIYINIDVFNGNNEEIVLKKITGAISLKFKGAPAATPIERGRLITPCFSSPRQNQFGALQAFYLILEQEVPQKLADEFLNWVDNTSYIFDFENLNIIVKGVDSRKETRLLLWDQAELPKNFWGRTANRIALMRPDRPLNMPTGQ
jgi:hypothetical protein